MAADPVLNHDKYPAGASKKKKKTTGAQTAFLPGKAQPISQGTPGASVVPLHRHYMRIQFKSHARRQGTSRKRLSAGPHVQQSRCDTDVVCGFVFQAQC